MEMRSIYGVIFLSVALWGGFGTAQTVDILSGSHDAIILSDETEFEVLGQGKAYVRYSRKVQINNDEGKGYGIPGVSENKFIKKKKIDVRILSTDGEELKKYKNSDILKEDYSPGYSLYSDSRYQWINSTWPKFPYVVEYSTEAEMSTLFFWPDWFPQKNVPVLSSSYKLVLRDTTVAFRTHAVNMETSPKTIRSSSVSHIWNAALLPAFESEDYMSKNNSNRMILYFTPERFALENSFGHFRDWNGLAQWYRGLTADRLILPELIRQEVAALVNPDDDAKTKIRKLYAYLQNNSRYVSIDLGIGGWQPYSAQSVFENKYGDCKDLSTLMVAMLDVVNIPAHLALTPTRDAINFIEEFPSNQFNHCIAVVPLPEDTVWLECTADYIPAGELPYSVEGAKVLVVEAEGGKIIQTPVSRPEDNLMTSRTEGRIGEDGALQMSGWFATTGNRSNYVRGRFIGVEIEKQQDWLRSRLISLSASRFDLAEFTVENLAENVDQPCVVHFSGEMKNFATRSASRLFLSPNVINQFSKKYPPEESPDERKFSVSFNYAFEDADTVYISLPPGYALEAAPPQETIESEFGTYRIEYELADNRLRYLRQFRLETREIPLEKYAAYREFISEVVKRDNMQFVLKR
ncbi:MAG: transglutaminase domain-containing protein [Calditrichia bacterium]